MQCSMICLPEAICKKCDFDDYFQGIRLKKFYESWEDNSDIGFVMMKVGLHLLYQLLGFLKKPKFCV